MLYVSLIVSCRFTHRVKTIASYYDTRIIITHYHNILHMGAEYVYLMYIMYVFRELANDVFDKKRYYIIRCAKTLTTKSWRDFSTPNSRNNYKRKIEFSTSLRSLKWIGPATSLRVLEYNARDSGFFRVFANTTQTR